MWTEAYHLEAINSNQMLGFFSEPIIFGVLHTIRHDIVVSAGAMVDTVVAFVLIVVCRFLTFFCAHQENQTVFFFLEPLVQYQASRFLKSQLQVSIFFVSKQV